MVAYALNTLMERQACLDQDKITNEIHVAVQELYHKGCIKFMNSCLKEVINTAFGRFAELQVFD